VREMTAQERTLRARIGALVLHATHDAKATTAAARAAFLGRFELQVDPDGLLPLDERLRRAGYARKAHFARLALASARKRSQKTTARPGNRAAVQIPGAEDQVGDINPTFAPV
jgi:hypothetical protein